METFDRSAEEDVSDFTLEIEAVLEAMAMAKRGQTLILGAQALRAILRNENTIAEEIARFEGAGSSRVEARQ